MMQGSSEYRIVSQLGQGNYGKAYLVERVKDQVQCVIKQIDMQEMSEDERKEAVKEANTLQMLQHKNIIKYHEHYKTKKGRLCIVMEYAAGGDLGQVIQAAKTPISEEQIVIWLGQIASALSYVHSMNIIHRDIKAQNVFLSESKEIKLADFGIARILASKIDKAQTFIGTPYYLAPELVDSKPYSVAVDIWSLGVLIYQLCTLKPPFDSENIPSLMLKISRGHYQEIPAFYSKELRKLVGEMLTVDPSLRITADKILENPLLKKLRESQQTQEDIGSSQQSKGGQMEEHHMNEQGRNRKNSNCSALRSNNAQLSSQQPLPMGNSNSDKKPFRVRSPVPKIVSIPSNRSSELKDKQQQIVASQVVPAVEPFVLQQPQQQHLPSGIIAHASHNLDILPIDGSELLPNTSNRLTSPTTRLPALNPSISKLKLHPETAGATATAAAAAGETDYSSIHPNDHYPGETPLSQNNKQKIQDTQPNKPSCFPSPKLFGNNNAKNSRPNSALVGIASTSNLLRNKQQPEGIVLSQHNKKEQLGAEVPSQPLPPPAEAVLSSLAKRRDQLKSAKLAIIGALPHTNNNNPLAPLKVENISHDSSPVQAEDNTRSQQQLQQPSLMPLLPPHSPTLLLVQPQQDQSQQQKKFLIKKSGGGVSGSQKNLSVKNASVVVAEEAPLDGPSIQAKNQLIQTSNQSKEEDYNSNSSGSYEATQQIKLTAKPSGFQELKTAKKIVIGGNSISTTNNKQIASQPSLEFDNNNNNTTNINNNNSSSSNCSSSSNIMNAQDIWSVHPKRSGSGSFVTGASPSSQLLLKAEERRRKYSTNTEEDISETTKGFKMPLFKGSSNYVEFDKESRIERKIIVQDPFQDIKRKRKNTDISQKDQIMSENEDEEITQSLPKLKQGLVDNAIDAMKAQNIGQQCHHRNQKRNQSESISPTKHRSAGKEVQLKKIEKKPSEQLIQIKPINKQEEEKKKQIKNKKEGQEEGEEDYDADKDIFKGNKIAADIFFESPVKDSDKKSNQKNKNQLLKPLAAKYDSPGSSQQNNNNNTPPGSKNNSNKLDFNNNNNNIHNKQQPVSHFELSPQSQAATVQQSPPDRVQTLRDQLEKEIGTIHFSKVYQLAAEALTKSSSLSGSTEFSQNLKIMFPSITQEFIQKYTTLFHSLILFDQH